MHRRIELQAILEDITPKVYFQPPATIDLVYPCIIYSRTNIDAKYANNKLYLAKFAYQILVISKNPDNPMVHDILDLPLTSYDRHYVSDNLHHDVLTIYY